MATPVIMPRQGQSVESCIIGEWYKKKGDQVKEGEIILSYETDKAAFDLESPVSGKILEIFFNIGDEVPVLTNIAVIGQEGEPVDEFKPGGISRDKTSTKETSDSTGEISPKVAAPAYKDLPAGIKGKIRISPLARKLSEKLNIPIQQIKGSGPQGRIVEKDVRDMAASLQTSPLDTEIPVREGTIQEQEFSDREGKYRSEDLIAPDSKTTEDFIIKKLSNIRKIISENMHASLQNSAQLTHHTSADARKILEYRKIFKADPEKAKGENITINDMVCCAVIKALKIKPEINSHFLGDSIKTFSRIHLGIAVDTERGLMVPALRNADEYPLPELSRALKSLADQCRKGNINPELLAGTAASFTVSNLGIYGVEMFTPVLYLPQAGILGVNAIIHRPADLGNGVIGFIPVIGLSLTYDHRAIDGAPASAFLKEVRDQIETFDIEIALDFKV